MELASCTGHSHGLFSAESQDRRQGLAPVRGLCHQPAWVGSMRHIVGCLVLGILVACDDGSAGSVAPDRDASNDGAVEMPPTVDAALDAGVLDAESLEQDADVRDAYVPDNEDSGASTWEVIDLELERLSVAPPSCSSDIECDEPLTCRVPVPNLKPACGLECAVDEDCGQPVESACSAAPDGEPTCVERRDEAAYCGIPFLAACKVPMECMPFSAQGTTGSCFQPCFPARLQTGCPAGLSCLLGPGWVRQGEARGICAVGLQRGERCDERPGDSLRCGARDTCAPGSEVRAPWTCRRRCDPNLTPCPTGECRAFGKQDSASIYACY